MNLNDISVDCESLSVHYDAPLLSIGAVRFDRTTGKLGATFYEEIAIDSAIKHGRPLADTLRFWINQSKAAKRVFDKPDTQKQSLATVLMNFSTWCRAGEGPPRVWVKGPAEDVTWINHAMTVGGHGLAVPWVYNNVRDVRTILELAEEIAGFDKHLVGDIGTAHHALDDAKYQANLVCAAYAALRSYVPAKRQVAAVKQLEQDDEL